MEASPQQPEKYPPVPPSVWAADRPKNVPGCYEVQNGYKNVISWNELFTILAVFEAVSHRTISILTTEIKARRKVMEEALKSLRIVPKILARSSNSICDNLLSTSKEPKDLSGSILTTKSMGLQTVY